MWPVSDRFERALPHGHRAVARIEVLQGETVIEDLTELGVVVDGTVTVSHSETARSGSLQLVDRTGALSPRRADDLFAPTGNQIRLWRGIKFSDAPGDEELVPLITARFTRADVPFPRVELPELVDRSWIVARAKLITPLTIAVGTNKIEAIGSLLSAAMPGVLMNLPTTDEVTSQMLFDSGSDPWEMCQDMAANLGYRLLFDAMGVATMVPEPSESDPWVWEFDDTRESCMALPGVQQAWSGVGFNAQVVIAENSDMAVPLRGVAYDTDPNSPMRWGGPFGRSVAPEVRDEKIASVAQATARARKELESQLGLIQTITIPSMPHPALDVLDPVRVNIERLQQTNDPPILDRVAIVDSLAIPLRRGNTSISTRERRVVGFEP